MGQRLIDANAIPALFDEQFRATRELILQGEEHLDNLAEGFTEAHKVIMAMPTIDAVLVVRCSECKHWMHDVAGCTENVGRCELVNYLVYAAGYCVYGERSVCDG